MTMRIGINGFGRIGRNVLRLFLENPTYQEKLEIVSINDLTDAGTLAHLLQHDSVYGRLPQKVTASDGALTVADKKLTVTAEKDPTKLDWKSQGVDLVLECTGIFRKKAQAEMHLQAGAKKVLISAPSPDPDITLAYGVNHDQFDSSKHSVLSCASCTTNCLAPVVKVLHDSFGIERGTMTTIHSYTNDQNILDLPHKDLRRARAAALSMIPTTTGAAAAVGLVLPELNGKIDGFAIRVPTPVGSIVDFVGILKKNATKEEVNSAFKSASESSLKGILDCSDEPLVSSDYVGNAHSSIVDTDLTMVLDGNMVKAIAWYDNEMGFSCRMLDVSSLIAEKS